MEPVDTTDPEPADMVETATAVIHRVVPMADFTDFFDRSFTELATVLARQGIAPAGPPTPTPSSTRRRLPASTCSAAESTRTSHRYSCPQTAR